MGIICTIPSMTSSNTFILDTGATYHVCYTKKYFEFLRIITPITIKFPNGALVTICFAGTVTFDHSLYITDGLYIPNFAFKLIFIPKLTKTLNRELIFNDVDCTKKIFAPRE